MFPENRGTLCSRIRVVVLLRSQRHGVHVIPFEPRHEQANILHMRKQRRRSAQRLCFRFIDSKISLLPKSEISSL